MFGQIFLWAGFVLSCVVQFDFWSRQLQRSRVGETESVVDMLELLVSGISLSAFGYLLFG